MQDSKKFVDAMLEQIFGRADIYNFLTFGPREGWKEGWEDFYHLWDKIAPNLFTKNELAELGNTVAKFLPKPFCYKLGAMDELLNRVLPEAHAKTYQLDGAMYLVEFVSRIGREAQSRYVVLGREDADFHLSDFVRFIVPNRMVGFRGNQYDAPIYDYATSGWEFLEHRLEKLVTDAKTKAQSDFANACAVSADGTDIATADKVCLVGGNSAWVTEPASKFHDRKLVKPHDIKRYQVASEDQYVAIVQTVARKVIPAAYVVFTEADVVTRYLVVFDEIDLAP